MIRRIIHSLTFRLALMFSICAFVVLLSLGFVVLYAVNQHFISQDLMTLEAQRHRVIHTLAQSHDLSDFQKQLASFHHSSANTEHDFIIVITDQNNHLIFKNSNHDLVMIQRNISIVYSNPLLENWCNETTNYRALIQPIEIFGKSATLTLAFNIDHHEIFLASFKKIMWLSIAIAAFLMGILACIVTKQGLRPLHILVNQTEKITADNLSQRLPVMHDHSEIAQLTLTFNEMLNRLDIAFQRLTAFSSDLAHELRTPLSAMKLQYQVILSKQRTSDEYEKALQDNAEELEHLITMVTDMLFLAKSENGLIHPDVQLLSLHDEINVLSAFYEQLAEEKNISIQILGTAHIHGDKALLRRAISNLMTNAITYGYVGTQITIKIEQLLQFVYITIENHSDTIEEAHLPHLFERFYRLDSARESSKEGAGLGLAITKAIILAHQGNITVNSAEQTTRFTIAIPVNQHIPNSL